MTEEIFGPLLPIVEVGSMDEAIDFVRARPKPLSLYVFSNSERTVDRILARTTSGGAVVNDVLIHFVSGLPFGGVGQAGMGQYHGKATFDAFSHHRSVVKKSVKMDVKLRYPPYKASMELFKKVF